MLRDFVHDFGPYKRNSVLSKEELKYNKVFISIPFMKNLHGSGENTKRVILFSSEKNGNPIGSGDFQEQYISLKKGFYSIIIIFSGENFLGSEEIGYPALEIFSNSGQRVASSQGNIPFGSVHFFAPLELDLKFKISRSAGKNLNCSRVEFYIGGYYTPGT